MSVHTSSYWNVFKSMYKAKNMPFLSDTNKHNFMSLSLMNKLGANKKEHDSISICLRYYSIIIEIYIYIYIYNVEVYLIFQKSGYFCAYENLFNLKFTYTFYWFTYTYKATLHDVTIQSSKLFKANNTTTCTNTPRQQKTPSIH